MKLAEKLILAEFIFFLLMFSANLTKHSTFKAERKKQDLILKTCGSCNLPVYIARKNNEQQKISRKNQIQKR